MKKIASKKLYLIGLPVILLVGIFLFGHGALAVTTWATDVLTGLIGIIISALGLILILVMKGLLLIANYQHFIDPEGVVNGWKIVRDVCNMFFVLILLIIAFGTILNLPEYSYKKWLPKLILMAILINFSKTICGLLIDFAQVVMLTFVNAFKDVAGANLINILGIKDIVTLAQSSEAVSDWEVIGAYVLGLIYLVIATIVITAMLAMLAMRLVMIWIYVVLSPFAYLLAAFPGGSKYSCQWWSEFTKNLIVGPVLAFFIWLSFATLQTGSVTFDSTQADEQAAGEINATIKPGDASSTSGSGAVASTEASKPSSLIKFVIAIGMLLGGMKIAQEIGGQAGSLAGSVASKGKKLAIGAAAGAGILALKGAKQPISWGVDKIHHKTGVDLNVARTFRGMKERRKELKERQYSEGMVRAGEAMTKGGIHGVLAMSGNPGDAWDELSDWKGIKPRGILKRVKSVGARKLVGMKGMEELKEEGVIEKESAEKKLGDAMYRNDFINSDKPERQKKWKEVVDNYSKADTNYKNADQTRSDLNDQIKDEVAKGEYADEGKIASLQDKKKDAEEEMKQFDQEKKMWSGRTTFVGNNINHNFTDKEKFEAREEVRASQKEVESAQEKIDKNIMGYAYEARAAEQKSVQEEGKKISNITDATELVRILKTAIESHDTSLVKATMLKLTKDYNDNEALKPLVGDTSYKGLQELMRQFSTKGSKNYAGFSEQEAFGLGSQIAEINKATNHWGATSAYLMENGKWRETSEKEHVEIRSKETDKMQVQAFLRNNNRLAYGKHDAEGKFHLDVAGIMMLKSVDTDDGHKNMNTMNRSAAKYIYDALMENPKLKTMFSQKRGDNKSLIDMLETRLGDTKDKDTMQLYEEAKEGLS